MLTSPVRRRAQLTCRWPQAALKLPRGGEGEVAARQAALQAGLRSAVAVPLTLQRRLHQLWEPLDQLAPLGNITTKSDLQVSPQHRPNSGPAGRTGST